MSHAMVALSEPKIQEVFGALRDKFVWEKGDSGSFGAFSAGYDVKIHLEGGIVELSDDKTIHIKELDIKWEKLDFWIAVDIPTIKVGDFCIIPTPFGCALRAPGFTLFEGSPDIRIPLPLGGLITSEVSLSAKPRPAYYRNPNRPASMDDWQAAELVPPLSNQWRLFLDPETIDLDVIDIADSVGDLFENALRALIDPLVPDFLNFLIDTACDAVRTILDLGDDMSEWISDQLNRSFGLFNQILNVIADYFASKNPLFQIEDPFPLLPPEINTDGTEELVAVRIPIRGVTLYNNDKEMILEANVG